MINRDSFEGHDFMLRDHATVMGNKNDAARPVVAFCHHPRSSGEQRS
jgi:hypothetical protein